VTALPGAADAEPVQVTGRIEGGDQLLNPVWNAAKDTKNHRFTFRVPSATVSAKSKTLTAYLPKELCIVALSAEAASPNKVPTRVVIAGGRTTPVTVVVQQGQQVQFENHDPFPHRLYATDKAVQGMAPTDTEPNKNRTWTPAGPGKYELRDERAPSVLSWIVVEPKAVKTAYPNFKNEFQLELEPGSYTLQGYFNGAPVGKSLPLEVKPAPKVQKIVPALVVGEAPPPPPAAKKDKGG
jgi:plastocyanin